MSSAFLIISSVLKKKIGCTACGLLFPEPRMEPVTCPDWKQGVLNTEPAEKCQSPCAFECYSTFRLGLIKL